MKKLIASFVLISMMAIGIPKMVNAGEGPCATIIICNHFVTVCQGEDVTDWVSLLCGNIED